MTFEELSGVIGERIRTLREARGVSQRGLADKLGVSHARISDIELGKGNPTIRTLTEIADALDTEVSFFLSSPRRKRVS